MSQSKLPRTSLSDYFGGLSQRLRLQVQQMTPIIVHSGEMGDNDQEWLSELIKAHLPRRFGVETGFVVNRDSDRASADFFSLDSGSRDQDDSIGPQTDILITDDHYNAPFCRERSFAVCPVEMVVSAIEVTRSLNADKLTQDLSKLSRVRKLAATKSYLSAGCNLRPGAYVVGLGGSLSLDAVVSAVKPLDDDLRPNAIMMLGKQEHERLYVRKPYTTEFTTIDQDVLYHFIGLLRFRLETFVVGPVDMAAYLPFVKDM
jgi:hypothetical protein